MERYTFNLSNDWVTEKVYDDVRENTERYREFCAVCQSDESGEIAKSYLPYSQTHQVSFKMNTVKEGDVLYMGYYDKTLQRTVMREYLVVLYRGEHTIITARGFCSYYEAHKHFIAEQNDLPF